MASGDWYPFFLVDRVTLDANGAGTATLSVGSTEDFEGDEIDFVVSSGTFVITKIQDQGGKGYTNASTSDPIPSAVFLTALDQRSSVGRFSTPLKLAPNSSFNVEFASGTATATIDVIVKGKKRSLA